MATPGAPPRSSGRRRIRRPGMATSARSCRWSIAGRMTTACRASFEDFIPQNQPPATRAIKVVGAASAIAVHGRDSGHRRTVALRHLTEKPWLAERSDRRLPRHGCTDLAGSERSRWECFSPLSGSLFVLSSAPTPADEHGGLAPALPCRLLWLNTGVLVLSSVALQWAHVAARRNDMERVIVGLCAGGASAACIPCWATAGLATAQRRGVFRDVTTPPIPSST